MQAVSARVRRLLDGDDTRAAHLRARVDELRGATETPPAGSSRLARVELPPLKRFLPRQVGAQPSHRHGLEAQMLVRGEVLARRRFGALVLIRCAWPANHRPSEGELDEEAARCLLYTSPSPRDS